jgi:hypothetical protein
MVRSGTELKLIFFPGAKGTAAGIALLETLELVPRAGFTAALPRMEDIRPMGDIREITVHHTGFPEAWLADDMAATANHLAEIQTLHSDPTGRNWADIGYHYAVDRMGRIWQLRDLRFQGAHVKNHNAHNAGIVVLGNFDWQTPTTQQTTALTTLLNFMRDAFHPIHVATHRELADSPTSCPGKYLQMFMDQNFRTSFKEFA